MMRAEYESRCVSVFSADSISSWLNLGVKSFALGGLQSFSLRQYRHVTLIHINKKKNKIDWFFFRWLQRVCVFVMFSVCGLKIENGKTCSRYNYTMCLEKTFVSLHESSTQLRIHNNNNNKLFLKMVSCRYNVDIHTFS